MLNKKITFLKSNSGVQKYLKNSSWLLGQKVLDMAVGLFVTVWVVRYLGPSDFGSLSYALSFVGLFSSIATLGLDGILVRDLVNEPVRRNYLLGSAFVLRFVGGVCSLFLIAAGTYFLGESNDDNTLIYIISFGVILRSFNVIDLYFQSKVLSKYVAYAKTIALGLSSIAKIALLLNGAPLVAFALMVVLEALVLMVSLIFFYCKAGFNEVEDTRRKILNWNFDINTAKTLLRDSWPLMLGGIVISIYMKIDQIMIHRILGAEFVGQYAAATKLSELWYFIPVLITSSLFPALINAKKNSKQLYIVRLQRLYTFLLWLAVSIAIPMTFLSEIIVVRLYGDEYQLASDILRVHIWAGIFVFIGVASDKWLITEGIQMFSLRNCAIGALINIILNFYLIGSFGVVGAAYSTLVSQGLAAYLLLYVSNKTRVNFYAITRAVFISRAFK